MNIFFYQTSNDMAETKIKRRYRQGDLEYKQYNDYFDRFLLNSNILNGGNQAISVHTEFHDLVTLKRILVQLEGDETGRYKSYSGETVFSSISLAKKKLAAVQNQFDSYCDTREAQGHPRPKSWPSHLLDERLRCEARIDVLLREAEAVRDRIGQYQALEDTEHIKGVLAFGPRGNGRLREGILVEIDGQTCDYHNDVLIISDPNSPYHGMKVSDYREHISNPWLAERRRWQAEKEKKRAEEILQKGFSHIEVRLSSRKIDKSCLPAWPECVPNMLMVSNKKSQRVDESGKTH